MSTEFVLDWIERKVGLTPAARLLASDLGKLAAFEPLVIAAAVFFGEVDGPVLADLLEIDHRQLSARLDMLADHGVLVARPPPARARYAFASATLRHKAYATLAGSTSADLHRKIAQLLAERTSAPGPDAAAEIARQWQAGGDGQQAAHWWRTASAGAAAQACLPLAMEYLDHALAICRAPQFQLSPHQELLTLSALGPLQAQLTGSGSNEVAAIYARCQEIAETYAEPEAAAKFDVLWGLAACILVHGRVGTALELCEHLLRSAAATGDSRHLLLSSRLKGLGQLLAGELPAAMATLADVIRQYDFDTHADLRLRYASDQAALALAHLAWAQTLAGDLEASERSSDAALEQVQMLNHPHTSAHVICVLAARAQTLNLRRDAAVLATGGLALARHYHYPYWQAWAEIILGWHEGGRNPSAGAARIDGAIIAYQRTGAGQALPYAHLLRAALALGNGQRTMAIAAADQALASGAAHGVTMFDADILRIKALAQQCRDGERQQLLLKALWISRRQGAKLFETRLTSALA